MNAIREMYKITYAANPPKNDFYLVNNVGHKENYVTVNGKTMSKHELNEKLAYFYEHGGPVMDM